MESSNVPAEGADVSHACETGALCQSCELEESGESQLTHDWSDTEMDDSGSFISYRPLSSFSGLQGPSFSTAWALALYGEDCFSQEVVDYTCKLGNHNDSPSLEDKTQVGHLYRPAALIAEMFLHVLFGFLFMILEFMSCLTISDTVVLELSSVSNVS